MKRGRPFKNVSEFDKDLIIVKLSFNDIKYFIEKYESFDTDTNECKLGVKMAEGLRQYLISRSKEGKLPQQIIDIYVTQTKDEFVDKSTIKQNKEDPENG